jgi:hypothetical protein
VTAGVVEEIRQRLVDQLRIGERGLHVRTGADRDVQSRDALPEDVDLVFAESGEVDGAQVHGLALVESGRPQEIGDETTEASGLGRQIGGQTAPDLFIRLDGQGFGGDQDATYGRSELVGGGGQKVPAPLL